MTIEEAEARSAALDEALEKLDELADALREAGVWDDPRFRAYHKCQIEGRQGGWLGGPFLRDYIEDAMNEADDEADDLTDGEDDDAVVTS